MTQRIVIADDHALVRAGLRALLERIPDVAIVGEAADAESAMRLFEIEKLENFLKGYVVPEGAGDEYQTIAGWFSQRLARVPTEGDTLEESNWRFEIVDMDGIRVDKVLAMRITGSTKA